MLLPLGLADFTEYLAVAATAVGAVTAGIGLSRLLRGAYRRTLGRRRDYYRRLARLGTFAQLSFFEAVLGEPPALRRTVTPEMPDYAAEPPDGDWDNFEIPMVRQPFTECFFIDRDFYVQTISDQDETVLGYSVTTRSRRFRPRFYGLPKPSRSARRDWKRRTGDRYEPFLDIQLGKTPFASCSRQKDEPDKLKVAIGAHDYWYSELYSWGNPSNYQAFVLTASNAAGDFPTGSFTGLGGVPERWPDPDDPLESADFGEFEGLPDFRERTVITTYTVIGMGLPEDYFPSTFGPNHNIVRTIP